MEVKRDLRLFQRQTLQLIAKLVACIGLGLIPNLVMAQETVLYKDAKIDYENLVKEYDQGYYGRCVRSAEKYLASYQDPDYYQLRLDAELYQLKSKLRMDSPAAVEDVLAFAKRNQPGAVAQRAILLAGDDAYSKHQYEEAINYFTSIDDRFLSGEEKSGLHFKLGYCLFIRKD